MGPRKLTRVIAAGFTIFLLAADSKPIAITTPTLFNTPEADRVLAHLQIFPPNNPWHEDISQRPLLPNSQQMLAGMSPQRRMAFNRDMGFVLVPPNQKRVEVKITDYPDESDPGPYPVPDNATIEGWPVEGGSLANIQRNGESDRHLIVVDPVNLMLYEFWVGRRTDTGWTAAQGSIFDLKTNKLRPDGWTSSDAAGLPIFPAVVRYDELQRGVIDHALRVTFHVTRKAYVYPATHFASNQTNPNLPRMGERLRLRADFDLSGFSKNARTVGEALKKYGMFVADNGGDWRISISPDERITGLDDLGKIHGKDFEIIEPTGPDEGPRAAK
jgi:hypothetical protein